MLKRCLEESGLNIDACVMVNSLAEAQAALHKRDFDVILTDLTLPDCRGLDTVTTLLSVCDDAPLLVMTDDEDEQVLQECLSGGAEDFIPKGELLQVNLNRSISYALLRSRAKRDDRAQKPPKIDDTTDCLTRFALLEQIGQNKELKEKQTLTGTLLACSIDNFSELTDVYGMAVSDDTLHQAAIRLTACLPSTALCARIAHHEFACWLPAIEAANAQLLAEELLQAFERPLPVRNALVNCQLSVGLAKAGETIRTPAALLSCAITANAQAREQHSRIALYNEQAQQQLRRRHQIRDEFADALASGDIYLVYQQLNSLKDDTPGGFEVLSRWHHPDIGRIAPLEFVDIAEEFGWIEALDECVLEQACRQLGLWQRSGKQDLGHLAVNVSVKTLMQPHFPKYLYRCLSENQLNPEQLWLEITESSLIPELGECKYQLSAIRELGVVIAIDDFGTGYSSLAYLGALPVDVLKIDASFIAGLGVDDNQEAILRHILLLGESLKLKIVAEGVETRAQLEALKEMGCDFVQGFYFGRPNEADKLEIPIKTASE